MDFFHEKPVLLKKNEKCYFIFYYKNRNACKFHPFTIKNEFGSMSETGEFRLECSLNLSKHLYKILSMYRADFKSGLR